MAGVPHRLAAARNSSQDAARLMARIAVAADGASSTIDRKASGRCSSARLGVGVISGPWRRVITTSSIHG
jgi:hypothetical protein